MMRIRFNLRSALLLAPAVLCVVGGVSAQAADADKKVEQAAKESYNFKTYLKGDSIKVDCEKGVVKLTGTVSEDYHKSLAEQTVAGLPGVNSVDNQLMITGTQPSSGSDEWITMKVKSSLAFHKGVSATGTEVTTNAGVVSLSGSVDTSAEKELTAEYARDVEGVKDVANNITVSKSAKSAHKTVGESIDDTSITAQIKTSLLFHKSVRSMATKVITKEGNVSLHGEAKTEAEKNLVTKLAQDIKGVKRVSNHMTIAKS